PSHHSPNLQTGLGISPDAKSIRKRRRIHSETKTRLRMTKTSEGSVGRRLTAAEVMALVDEHFPQVHEGNGRVTLEYLGPMTAHVRMAHDPRIVRPGGTISGPAMFKVADFAV